MQGQRSADIPGLFSSDQTSGNVDWSADNGANNNAAPAGSGESEANTQGQNSMIILGGKSLLADLTMEKDNLGQGYVHSHRLLEKGAVVRINAHRRHVFSFFLASQKLQGSSEVVILMTPMST